MAEETYTTKLKIEADTKGADQAAAAYEKIGRTAKKASEESKKGFEAAKQTIEGTSRAAELFNKVLRGFGFISIFTMLLGAVEKLRDAFRASKERAREFAEEARKAADTKRIEKLTEAWKKLEDQISSAAAAQARAHELEDMQRDNARKLEDDQAELSKQKELAALDPNDPLYDKKKAQIESRYSAAAAKRSVARRQEDANIAADRAGNEAAAMSTEAMQRSLALVDERGELDRLKREHKKALTESVSDNELDANTWAEAAYQGVTRVLGMNGGWSRLSWTGPQDLRTDEGDAIREDAKKRSDELQKQIKDKEAQIAAQERKISELQSGADHLTQKATLHRGAAFGAETAMETASLAGSAAVSAADKAVTDEQARIADAHRARAALTAKRDELKAQIAAAQGRKDAAGLAVFNAQGAVDLAKANGGKGLAGAQGALADAQSTALSTNASADRLIAALTKALNDVNTKLKAAQTAIESQSKQTRYAWSEAPAGD